MGDKKVVLTANFAFVIGKNTVEIWTKEYEEEYKKLIAVVTKEEMKKAVEELSKLMNTGGDKVGKDKQMG